MGYSFDSAIVMVILLASPLFTVCIVLKIKIKPNNTTTHLLSLYKQPQSQCG